MPWELSNVDVAARSLVLREGGHTSKLSNLPRAASSTRCQVTQLSSQKAEVTASIDNVIRDRSHYNTDEHQLAYSLSPSEESQLLTPSKNKSMKKGGLPTVSNYALLPLNNLDRHLKKHRVCNNREKILEQLKKTSSKFLVQRLATSTKAKQM
jgi:predicted transcriptional regulator